MTATPAAVVCTNDVVTIRVGPSRTFRIPRRLLVQESGYFDAALAHIDQGRFVEAETGVITLDEESPTTFALFCEWLCADEQPADGDKEAFYFSFMSPSSSPDPWRWSNRLVKMWIFGDRRQIPRFQNYCLSTLWHLALQTHVLPVHCTRLIYEHTPDGSPLRGFIMRCHSMFEPHMLEYCLATRQHYYNFEALGELAVILSRRPMPIDPATLATLDICGYYYVPDVLHSTCR